MTLYLGLAAAAYLTFDQTRKGRFGEKAQRAVTSSDSFIRQWGSEIHGLVEYGDLQKVQDYLEENPKALESVANGLTPLKLSFITEKKDVFQFLLSKQQDPDDYLREVLYIHGERHYSFAKEFLKDIDFHRVLYGIPALHNFIMDAPRLALDAVELGAPISEPSDYLKGATPLHVATAFGRSDLVMHLIEKGAQIDAQDDNGNTPLHIAVERSWLSVKKLVNSGARVDLKNKEGKTAMELALEKGLYWRGRYCGSSFYPQKELPWFQGDVQVRADDGSVIQGKVLEVDIDSVTKDLYMPEDSMLFLRTKALAAGSLAPFFVPFVAAKQLAGAFVEVLRPSGDLVWRVARRVGLAILSPFYAVGLFFAGLYAQYDPMEGRKWMSRIAESWGARELLNPFSLAAIGNRNQTTIAGGDVRRYLPA